MVFGVPHIIEDLSKYMTLNEGDLVFTGTPKGVGKVTPGDLLEATLSYGGEDLIKLRTNVTAKRD